MEILQKLTAPMRAVGAALFPIVGKAVAASAPQDTSNVYPSQVVTSTIANDAAEDVSSAGGAWANTIVLYVGWCAVLFTLIGCLICKVFPKKYTRRRYKRKTTARKTYTRRRRTYKRRK